MYGSSPDFITKVLPIKETMLPEYAPRWNGRACPVIFLASPDLALRIGNLSLALRQTQPHHFPLVLKHASGRIDADVQCIRWFSFPKDDVAAGEVHRAKISDEFDLSYQRQFSFGRGERLGRGGG